MSGHWCSWVGGPWVSRLAHTTGNHHTDVLAFLEIWRFNEIFTVMSVTSTRRDGVNCDECYIYEERWGKL